MSKLTSRKFWVSVAAFLASIGASLTGYFIDNEKVMIAGVVCTMLSAAIYAAVEGNVDAKTAESSVQITEISDNRTTSVSGTTPSSIKTISDTIINPVPEVKTGDENAVS